MPEGDRPDTKGQPGLVPAALFGLCPDCGARSLFASLTGFAPKCRSCGLDFVCYNVGDGPAAFLILIIGALVVGLALWLELAVGPPWWVHALLWPPLVTALTIWGLRVGKAALLITEHRRHAGEAGRE